MSDRITKPIDLDDFYATLSRWITPANPALKINDERSQAAGASEKGDANILDVERGLTIANNNRALYVRLLRKFQELNSGFADTFGNAAAEHDQEKCISLAHTLKGSAANIGAIELSDAASALEVESRERAGEHQVTLGHVATQLDLVFGEIDRFLAQYAE